MFSSTPKELPAATSVGQAAAQSVAFEFYEGATYVMALGLKYKELGSPISVVTAAVVVELTKRTP